ncbi:MAG TPA: hypothetical protein G4O09_04225 [Dehalococcoidia bacterium]|nr:hypothetical protein [Dehalococcoidia bacterium]
MFDTPVLSLDGIVDSLPAAEKARFERIYALTATVGELRVPETMQPWVEQQFGSLDAVTRQKIVRVTNKLTGEETLFSKLRASRPQDTGTVDVELAYSDATDFFSRPYDSTPEDVFGRVVGKHCVTASNVAKFDSFHGLLVFNDFNPLDFTRAQIIDYIDVAREWALKAHQTQPEAKYFALIWNCLWRAGASIGHGHAHVMLTGGRHYARIERLRRAAVSYRQDNGGNYFDDLFRCHQAVGCALKRDGVGIMAYLTPFKDKEVIIMADELSQSFKEKVYEVLACFRDKLGVASFNLGLVTPPLAPTEESWQDFPVMVRVVDRGNPHHRASDVGGMEVYAASVVSSDPIEITGELAKWLPEEVDNG